MSGRAGIRRGSPPVLAHHQVREHGDDLREEGDERDADHQAEEEGNRRAGDGVAVLARHVLQHEEVESHRRCDLGDFHQQHDEDAEPHQVEAGLLDHRQDHRAGEHDHADAVERRAQHQVHDREHRDQGIGRQVHGFDPFRQLARYAGKGHGLGEEGRAREDEHDHAAGACRAHQAFAEIPPRQRPTPERQAQRSRHPEGRALGGRGIACHQHPDDEHDQHRDGDEVARLPDLLVQRGGWIGRRHPVGMPQAPPADVAREQQHEQQPRQEARQEDADDGGIGGHRIHHHGDGGRDEDAQRAGRGQRAEGQALVVAAPQQFRQRHLADGGAGGGRGSRHRAEDAAAQDGGVHQPARHPVEPGPQAFEHLLAQPRAEQDLAHPDEKGQRGQLPARIALPKGREQVLAGLGAGEEGLAHPAADGQRHRDPDAAREQHDHHQQQDAAHHQDVHGTGLSAAHGAAWILGNGGASDVGGEVPARVALLDRAHEARGSAAHHDEEFVQDGHQQQHRADGEAQLGNPHRQRQQALGHVVEFPALVREHAGGPGEVGRRHGADGERRQLQGTARARRQLFQQQGDTHEIAVLEGMGHGEEGRGRAQPGHHVVERAGAHARLAQDALGDHQRTDQRDTGGAQGACREVQPVEEATHGRLTWLRRRGRTCGRPR